MASFPRSGEERVFDFKASGTSPEIVELEVATCVELCRREGYAVRMLTLSAETFVFTLPLLPYARTITWKGRIEEALILDNLRPILRRPDRQLVVIIFSSLLIHRAQQLVREIQAAGVHVFCGSMPLPRASGGETSREVARRKK